MTDLIENERPIAKALLISIDTGDYDVEVSLEELKELTATAGAQVAGTMSQKRSSPDSATCIGAGRLEEAALFVKNEGVELVIFDLELSGSQIKNIEEVLDVRTIDRTMLILDIFAQRARSAEGRLQVELAQQRYLLPRLIGMGKSLSRLGGGIGTRGPGETKLESDRRHIRRRITALEEQLREVSARRKLIRDRRQKDGIITASIVGYTNVGKTTLLSYLTNAGILGENKLFATLDPTARGLTLPDGRNIMLVDTVGLIRRLPHHLVEAFRSTLEEAVNADLILNVCDATSSEMQAQREVTTTLLGEMGASDVPVITVINKCDQIQLLPEMVAEDVVLISAKSGYGIDKLLQKISDTLKGTHTRMTITIPYDQLGLTAQIRADGKIFSEEYNEEGLKVDALIDNKILHLFKGFK